MVPLRLVKPLTGCPLLAACACALGLPFAVQPAVAQTLVFAGFGDVSALTINGSAAAATGESGGFLRLADARSNQAGSVFVTQAQTFSSFSAAFQFKISASGGITDGAQNGADGLVFVLQQAGVGALGEGGSGIGFQGITPSVGIEFDTFRNNNLDDPDTNHLGFDVGGSIVSLATASVPGRFDNNTVWTAWVDYNGTAFEVRVANDGVRPSAANLTQAFNLTNTFGTSPIFIGFTSATGGGFSNHDLLNFTFATQFVAGGITAVPEPGAAALLALGLAAVGWRRWRRRT